MTSISDYPRQPMDTSYCSWEGIDRMKTKLEKYVVLGTLAAMAPVFEAVDASDFYHSPVAPHCRSLMNVPFTLADSTLDGDFLANAAAAGLLNLKGHRSVGGMRARIYNAMPEAGVAALVDFMREFERTRG